MNFLRFLSFAIGFMLMATSLYAEPNQRKYYFHSLDINDGLSQNTIHAIIQDRMGFMWFGSKDGLNRYDGLSIQTFMKEDGQLGNNFITTLHEDTAGTIWIGTDAGVYTYSPLTELIEPFIVKSDLDKSIQRSITMINSDTEGNIWISSDEEGLFFYQPETQKLTHLLSRERGDISDNVTQFLLNDNERHWVALYTDNLYYTNDQFKSLTPFITNEGEQPFKGDIINKIVKGDHNCLYIGSAKGGLKEINLTTKKVRDLLTVDKQGNPIYVREFIFYSENELWVGTEFGIYICNIKTGKNIHLQSFAGDPYSLNDNAIYSLYKDREGGVWIGSFFGGVNYYPEQRIYFEKIYPHRGMEEMGRRVRELCTDDEGTLWIGTEDRGLFQYNLQTGELKPFKHPAIYHNVHGLCFDGKYLWVGTFSGGLNRINLKTKSVKSYQKGEASNTLDANDIFTIHHSSAGALWIGTTSGLLRYNYDSDDFVRVPELNGIFIYDIGEDSSGNIWLATYVNGVYRLNIQTGEWKHFTYNPEDSVSLSYNKVLSIFEDSRRQLWFTTQGGGICRFDPSTETFHRYNYSTGLPNNVAHQIVEDDNGFFWITTNRGLVHFNPQTNYLKTYTTADGLLSNQFNYQSSYKDKTGKIYFGSIQGLIAFNPSVFRENKFIPPVVITSFSVFNKKVQVGMKDSPLKKSITISDEIDLSSKQNSFTLSVAALSYQAPDMNKLIYTLEGFDKEWYTTEKGVITYSNLPPGTYLFKVKGSNRDGVWNDTIRMLTIHIHPPFYLSVWAYIFYVLLFSGIVVYLIWFYRRRSAQRHRRKMEKFEREKERELYQSKIDFFTNVTHEIRTPLTLIKSPLENILKEKLVDEDTKEDLLIMDRNTDRLLHLTNQLLDFRKTESDGFKLAFTENNIVSLLKSIFMRFTPLAKQKGLDFTFKSECDELEASVDRETFIKIVSNLFANAIKFAETYTHILLVRGVEQFKVIVSNDGQIVPIEMREAIFQPFVQYKGGKEIVAGTGIGLALARSLTELHQGTLLMDTNLDCNRFILSVPITHQTAFSIEKSMEKNERIGNEITFSEIKKNQPAIMIVEDDPDMVSFLYRQLTNGYTVFTAGNGIEALEILRKEYVNLIISDIMMPDMDGMELCDQVKSDVNYSHIPIILLTAKTTLQSKIESLKLGADAYVEKPFSVELLKANIESLLENRNKILRSFTLSPFMPLNTIAVTKTDELFLKSLGDIVSKHMQNPDFSLDEMAELLNMSRSSLNRKIKGLLDLTPNDYIRIERLKKAATLLKEQEHKINEICYIVGFNTPSYFTKCFKEQFGVLPKDFISSLSKKEKRQTEQNRQDSSSE